MASYAAKSATRNPSASAWSTWLASWAATDWGGSESPGIPRLWSPNIFSSNNNPIELLIRHKQDVAVDGFGGFHDGGNAGIVSGALRACDMGLQNLELFG